MSKIDVLKFIIIALIVVCCVLVVLIIFSKMYIENSIAVSENSATEEDLQTNEIVVEKIDSNVVESPQDSPMPIVESPIPTVTYGPDIYYIKVNTQMNTVTIYTKDEFGDYTIPIKAMICSTGENTPKNCTYKISGKKWDWKLLFGNVYGQYTTHINDDILFHSVPYTKDRDPSSLEYWEYDKLGTTASLGCVRLTVEDAKWIYDNCLAYTVVEFYSSEVPGELGKPSVDKISDNVECRNWDPTDPNPNNPWNMNK